MSGALLFESDARSRFMEITGRRYHAMKKRLRGKGHIIPFTVDQLRGHLLEKYMQGEVDGWIQCRWCFRICVIEQVAFDHWVPLSRGGSPDLPNIDGACCAECNARKGEFMPEDFKRFLAVLDREFPHDRVRVLEILQQHPQLLASRRHSEVTIRELKQAGQWPKKQKALPPPMQKVIDQNF